MEKNWEIERNLKETYVESAEVDYFIWKIETTSIFLLYWSFCILCFSRTSLLFDAAKKGEVVLEPNVV